MTNNFQDTENKKIIRKNRGKTRIYRRKIVKNARKSLTEINREFLHEWMDNWNNEEYHLDQEDITKIMEALNHAQDILKEMARDLE